MSGDAPAAELSAYLAEDPAVATVAQPLTDVGNGRRYDAQHGATARYCYARKAWMIYDAGRWTRDAGDGAMVMAKATAGRLDLELPQLTDAAARKELRKWADYSESAAGLRRMLEMAQSERPITPAAFDVDPDVLNTPSGAVHLPSGERRDHRAEDYLSKMTAAPYDPAARHSVFDAFLARALPDPATRAYVQRAAGYSITGHASEEVMMHVQGVTGAGKTTFLDSMRAALGDYAVAADFDTFAPRKHPGGPREDLARLLDARWVMVSETPPGRRLAAGLVKIVAGRDPLVVRRLYENSVERVPTFKVWIAGNVRPPAPADDDAVWRRLREIPFTMALALAERDPAVKATLTDPAQAGPAVLAWLVDGARLWYAHGLGTAPAVETATAEYRSSMDVAGAYLDACTVTDPLGWISVAELRAGLERWGHEEGLHGLPDGRALADTLRRRGHIEKRTNIERGWKGLRPRSVDDPETSTTAPAQLALERVPTW